VDASSVKALSTRLQDALKLKPNRQQRDIPELGKKPKMYFHDNEHQLRKGKDKKGSPWVGKRPEYGKEPSGSEFSDDSEGEPLPTLEFLLQKECY
jgi:hypothetical protein